MNTSLSIRQPQPSDWAMIQAIASSVFESRKFGVVKVQEAEIRLLTAWERGFPLTSALQAVYVISGVPTLSPKAVWAQVIQHPEFTSFQEERIEDKSGKFFGYRITLKRKNGVQATREFNMDDAKRAGLDTKDNWKMYPIHMCFWRAIGACEDIVFPDVTLGLSRADELGATVTEDGSVIEGSWAVVEPPKPPQPTDQSSLLNHLLEQHGADAIMQANGGMIPATADEIKAVSDKLIATRNGMTLETVEEVAI